MYVLIWRYRVRRDREDRFVEQYGPAGSWARLFARSPGYLGTELLRDAGTPSDFVTVDRWTSEAHHRAFIETHGADYVTLDAECEALTDSESLVGGFTAV